MPSRDDTLRSMVQKLASEPRRPGRPHKRAAGALSPGRFVRLDRILDAAVEVHRREMEKASGLPIDFSDAMRDLVERGAKAVGVLAQAE